MTIFTYKLTSYNAFLDEFTRFLGITPTNQVMRLPEEMGSGFMKAFSFEGIDALVYDMTFHQEMLLKREKENTEFFTLNYDEVADPTGMQVTIENDSFEAPDQRNAYLYLTSSLLDWDLALQQNVNLKGLRVYLTPDWLRKYLRAPEKDDMLEQYIKLKAGGIWQKTIDVESKGLTSELLADQEQPLLYYQNKMFRLVEVFFDWLYNEMQQHPALKLLSRSDIMAARRIETLLTKDVTVLPPTIREMSRQFAMSESKLKKVFKAVFGLPPYEYFQKYRMQKARQLLLTGNHSIKDVGYTLGYSNLSNFTLAFKKEFGRLPSEVLREGK
ncbi:helix-turn-helix transcriptional regulator [Paracnuella aquatica]|uniref:helix-turn-helix transcriptional regulator n=1 Tax=Paracnuella aquatica TaxID=2268757 RepID=UPI000DEF1947|nr:AraC family transcriptional regulator [Paracnuella aquatica]RPD51778.1 AraC family transcriptional regulator [Paracnuella aquatica]